MVRTMLLLNNGEILYERPVEEIINQQAKWFWVDFSEPTAQEIQYLSDIFAFHHLAIEDCLHLLQRPKIDDFGDYRFFVLHAVSNQKGKPEEINLFVAKNYIVSFRMNPNQDLDKVWNQVKQNPELTQKGPDYLLYLIIDRLVDQYFPVLLRIDDELERLESENFLRPSQRMINRVFKIRKDLLSLRRSLEPYREVVREILHPEDEKWKIKYRIFFGDIYDHLAKLLEMTDTYRQIGSDLIESYVSLNSQRMNRVMVTLTVITTIFMPLTFLAGIYGMNFDNMPELHWKYGYFFVLTLMSVIAGGMVIWFRRRGWF
ncbi:magnesium/cobalt transporter CorA [Effusibacillus consociatus]|uniref:Magnesium transport protein CorA n=1 Tax=Effusibacillus consociatus TaxID=1117041 RepID=A0ABV9Q547_9BACL